MQEENHTCAYCGATATYQLKNGKWCCQPSQNSCPEIRRKNAKGLQRAHARGSYDDWNQHERAEGSWSRGKTKETDERLARKAAAIHQRYVRGDLISRNRGKHLSEAHKQAVSISMKKAHAEGRAHNIGECRWNNQPSWPEQWFMMVVENEFQDKNFKREVPFHRFSLDFAWIEKKCCIEIDGEQHERDLNQKKRDLEKDALLQEEGWQLLRMPWKEVYKEPTLWIAKAKAFIDG